MNPLRLFQTGRALAVRLRRLHRVRRRSRATQLIHREARQSLTVSERNIILEKTNHRCHICGGRIRRSGKWCADHILAYSHGGPHAIDNYLPAHVTCNSYRRNFGPEEFQWILKLGVWMRGQIAREDRVAMQVADRFVKHQQRTAARRKSVVKLRA
jgi:hypothetical protein